MSNKLIEAAANGDTKTLRELLQGGAAVDAQDEQGWTPLCWAAGRGDAAAVRLLLEHGADVTLAGRDQRTPLRIARAAERREVVEILAEAERSRGVWVDPRAGQPYCRAYYLGELRRFREWSESRLNWREPSAPEGGAGDAALTDDDIAYLHQDFTVTKSMWHEESVIFNRVTPEWRAFCEAELGFAVSEELV
jgi:hypothetical protein